MALIPWSGTLIKGLGTGSMYTCGTYRAYVYTSVVKGVRIRVGRKGRRNTCEPAALRSSPRSGLQHTSNQSYLANCQET